MRKCVKSPVRRILSTRQIGREVHRVQYRKSRTGQREAGGRVLLESALPNLSEWRRVIDWRLTQINKIENIYFYRSSPMTVNTGKRAFFKAWRQTMTRSRSPLAHAVRM